MTAVPNNVSVNQPTSDLDEDEIDFGYLLGALVESRWIIVAVTAAAVLVGFYQAFTATPIYRADALLQVEGNTASLVNLDAGRSLGGGYSEVSAEIEILRSRSVLGAVVDNLQLDINAQPEYMPYIGAALARRAPLEERPLITVDTLDLPDSMRGRSMKLVAGESGKYALYDASDALLVRGQVGEAAILELAEEGRLMLLVSELQAESGQIFWVSRGSRINRTQALQGSLSVVEQGEFSSILEISLEGANPGSITEQVNEVADVYVRQNVERKSAEAAKTLEFLEGQLPLVRQNVEAAELALNSYRQGKGSIDLPAETGILLQAIIRVEGQLNKMRQEREKVRLGFTEIHCCRRLSVSKDN
jgi:tyrosine-protein kinase Etk/Wzc